MADGVVDLTLTEQVGVCATILRLFKSRNDAVCISIHKVFYQNILRLR